MEKNISNRQELSCPHCGNTIYRVEDGEGLFLGYRHMGHMLCRGCSKIINRKHLNMWKSSLNWRLGEKN